MAGSRARRAPRRASLLRKDNRRGAEAVAPAESPRGRNAASSPAATGKSQRVSSRFAAAVADIGKGGETQLPPRHRIIGDVLGTATTTRVRRMRRTKLTLLLISRFPTSNFSYLKKENVEVGQLAF